MSHVQQYNDFLNENTTKPVAKASMVIAKDQITYTHGGQSFTMTRAELYNAILQHLQSGLYTKYEKEIADIIKTKVLPMFTGVTKMFIKKILADPNVQKGMADLFSSVFIINNPLFSILDNGTQLMGEFKNPSRLNFTVVIQKVITLSRLVVAALPVMLRPIIVIKDSDIMNLKKMQAIWSNIEYIECRNIVEDIIGVAIGNVLLPKIATATKRSTKKMDAIVYIEYDSFY